MRIPARLPCCTPPLHAATQYTRKQPVLLKTSPLFQLQRLRTKGGRRHLVVVAGDGRRRNLAQLWDAAWHCWGCHPAPVARGCGRAGPRGLAAQQGRGWPGSVEGSQAGAEPAPLHVRSGAPLVAFVLVRVISGSRESLPHSVMLVFPGGQGAAVMPLRRGQQRQSPPCRSRLRRAGTDPPPGRGVPDAAALRPLSLRVLLCHLCKKRRASEVARHDLCFPIGKRSKAPRRAGGDSPSPTSTTGR